MDLIPVFKKINRDTLEKDFNIKFPLSEWVSIILDNKEYECNRYDGTYYDQCTGRKISIYLYMDEDSSELYAIDKVVLNTKTKECYPIEETPFDQILRDILKRA